MVGESQTGQGMERNFHMPLPAELVDGWKKLAKARGLTMRALQELVMRNVLGATAESPSPPVEAPSEQGDSRNLRLRLLPGEQRAVRAAAAEEGHTITGWITMLIRARLRSAPVLTQAELEALADASYQLMAVGRNLNSLLRRLHQDEKWSSQTQLMSALLNHVRKVEAQVNALQIAGERRGEF